jgi:hypothetical protein
VRKYEVVTNSRNYVLVGYTDDRGFRIVARYKPGILNEGLAETLAWTLQKHWDMGAMK